VLYKKVPASPGCSAGQPKKSKDFCGSAWSQPKNRKVQAAADGPSPISRKILAPAPPCFTKFVQTGAGSAATHPKKSYFTAWQQFRSS
jgi:hypothetical protein